MADPLARRGRSAKIEHPAMVAQVQGTREQGSKGTRALGSKKALRGAMEVLILGDDTEERGFAGIRRNAFGNDSTGLDVYPSLSDGVAGRRGLDVSSILIHLCVRLSYADGVLFCISQVTVVKPAMWKRGRRICGYCSRIHAIEGATEIGRLALVPVAAEIIPRGIGRFDESNFL